MHATAIVAALAGIAASASGMGTDPVVAKGMKVDREMADGLYTFAITNGTVLQYAAPPAVSSVHTARHARTVAARGVLPNPDVACTGHDTVQNAMEHAAWQILVNWCQNGGIIPERQGVFAKVGNTVWYACSYAGRQPCNLAEVDEAGGLLGSHCHDASGWVGIDAWKKVYGREAPDIGICAGENLSQLN